MVQNTQHLLRIVLFLFQQNRGHHPQQAFTIRGRRGRRAVWTGRRRDAPAHRASAAQSRRSRAPPSLPPRPHTRTPSCAHVLDHEASKHDAEWSFTQRQVCLCNCLCPVGCCRPIHLRRHQTQTARRRMKTPATGAKLMRSVSSTTQTRWW